MPRLCLAVVLAVLLFCPPARAADPALERFAGPPPAMLLEERTGDPETSALFSGGWGYSGDDACRLLIPTHSGAGLLGAYAAGAQKLVITLRLSLECERAGLVPVLMRRIGRTIYTGPQDAVFECLEVELLAVPKERQAEIAALHRATGLSQAEIERRTREQSSRFVREFWFDVTDIRDHNAATLYGMVRKPRAVSSHGVPAGRLQKAAEPLQRSIYLEISPKDYATARPEAGLDPGRLDGGWGYDRESAFVQHAPQDRNELQAVIEQQMRLIAARNLLEFAQTDAAGDRLQPVSHIKREQTLFQGKDGRKYDRLLVDVCLVPSEAYGEAQALLAENTPEAQAALLTLCRKEEREFWFDVTEPLTRNPDLFDSDNQP